MTDRDRRASDRMAVNAGSACTFASPVAEDFPPVRIRDLSMEGIGLLMTRKVEPNTLLAVVIANPQKNYSKTLLVRVVHVTPQSGTWLIGGVFSPPLTYDEFKNFVM
ncbi:MAG: PilZ domain-containing protein [Gemmataceae bacterium]